MSDPSNCPKFFMADNRVILATARTRERFQMPNSMHQKHISSVDRIHLGIFISD